MPLKIDRRLRRGRYVSHRPKRPNYGTYERDFASGMTYLSAGACARCHGTERYTSGGGCVACSRSRRVQRIDSVQRAYEQAQT